MGMTRCELKVMGPWIVCLAVAACNGDKEMDSGVSASSGPAPASTSGDTLGASEGDDTTTAAQPTSAGSVSDGSHGSGDATSGVPDPGGTGSTSSDDPVTGSCGKLDLLFVIDSASTMAAEQQQLVAAFPALSDALAAAFGAVDLHVMVTSADDSQSLGGSQKCTKMGDCTCGPAPTCCNTVCGGKNTLTCNALACADLPFDECTFKYGTGRNFGADGAPCPLDGAARYMLGSQTDLAGTFACVAGVGVFDGIFDKRPMQAVTEAIGAAQNDVAGCNEGFVRPDAVLVVVVITDQDDANKKGATGSPGDPQMWHDAVVAAKGGNAESIVMLALGGDGNVVGGTCDPASEPTPDALGAAPAPRIQEFVGLFPHGAFGSVCAADYAPFLTDAVATIDQACAALSP